MVAEKSSNVVSERTKAKSCVHVHPQVGPMIWPTRSMLQLDPVAFLPDGLGAAIEPRNHDRTIRHRAEAQ